MAKKNNPEKFVKITYVKSAIGREERQKKTIRSLGIRKLNQTVVHRATPQILGMIKSVEHLVNYEFVDKEA
ncbi:MAG: 50S ribosomal protein L30 [Actinobacteria bacterium]|nr:50S ribosomal protein L30 [Actinomycetota bacterium]